MWIQIITQIICVTPTELLLWPPLSYNSWIKFAIQNPKVCYSFFIMGSPTCNGIIMHIVLSYLFFQNNIKLFSHFYTLSVHVIAKITVVFQCVNELHVNVWNDINHSWTLWLFYLTCNIFFILSDHHTLHTFYNLLIFFF